MNESNGNHQTRTHHLLGGSTAAQWVNCPGSAIFRSKMPPQTASDAAERGTRAHEFCEMVLHDFLEHKRTGSDPDIRAHLLSKVDDDDMLESVYLYRDLIWEHVLKHSITEKAYGFEEEFMASKSLEIGGPCDFWVIGLDDRGRRYGHVVDYKNGYVFVEAKGNPQLAVYSVGLRAFIREHGKDLDYVKASIIQPNGEGDPYRETTFTDKQLDVWEKKFLDAAKVIYVDQKMKLKVGKWCGYCQAQALCPKYSKEVETRSQIALVDAKADLERFPSPDRLTDEQLERVILNADNITDFIKACKSYALTRGLNGNGLPGLKVVNTKGRRVWRDEEDEVARVLMEAGVENPYREPKLQTITMIEKVLKKLHPTKKIEALMESVCTKSIGSEILVPLDDPRQAVLSHVDLLNET